MLPSLEKIFFVQYLLYNGRIKIDLNLDRLEHTDIIVVLDWYKTDTLI